jgi:hypothetical protein
MKTNATPAGRDWATPQAETAPAPAAPQVAVAASPSADTSDTGEPASVASEDPKPLSPQFAALAKRQRALQVKEREIQAREEALKQTSQSTTDAKSLVERMKADPLGLLLENGVTYDQLTQEVLKSMEGGGPALTRVETELKKEIKRLNDALETQTKTQSDTWNQAQAQALSQMQKQADQLIAADDAYQMIRETGSNKDVTALIKRIFDEEGETIDVKEALEMIESDLLEESLKIAKIKKVQSTLNPEPAPQQLQAPAPNDGVRRQTMRTLTNRDTVSAIPSRRDRAIAAAYGKKLA